MAEDVDALALTGALSRLAAALHAARLPLVTPSSAESERVRSELEGQIRDYLLPRLRQMDAPLLMVVGGSTGAGKSTLVNSLVGAEVSTAGVLRPTTRAPVLACHPSDVGWFEDDRILPGLARTRGGAAGPGGLALVPTDRLPPGLALLDAPDIDSVVEANRALAGQLLAAADSWLFVTTAARYADAVPWDLLGAARERGTALSLVLDRVPPEAAGEIAAHLAEMLGERGLAGTPVLVVPETTLESGRLPASALAPVRDWLDDLAADAQARAGLVRRTLTGALDSVPGRARTVRAGLAEQEEVAAALRAAVDRAYADALEQVDETVRSGALLRGEVLARWHDVVGTGDVMRALETRVGRLRDRLRELITGAPAAEAELRTAVQVGVDAVVLSAADRAAERAAAAWQAEAAGRPLLDGAGRLDAAAPDLAARTGEQVRAWQGEVLDLVRAEGSGKRATARLASLGVNGAGLTVMIAVFASTGGLTGAEVVVAGGTSALGQKVLEAIFGDQAVRALAERAREQLMVRVGALLDEESGRFARVLEPVSPPPGRLAALDAALEALERAR
ncbi:MAG TPA: GTPase domain-containing protein [Solirubrobacteraceae bacterium]|nr:GTPase domain-containing protein [Solirubrobacteraceae bacterium]